MIYGYARISRPTQNIERQIRNILAIYPDAHIIQEKYTGTVIDRPAWNRLTREIREGDTVVFDSVSRMSRNAAEGFEIYERLFSDGINLEFIREPQINTATYKTALQNAVPLTGTSVDLILKGVNDFLMELAREQIRLAFGQAEKEVNDLHQRTREGIETARRAGKQIGQPKGAKLTTKKSIAAKEIIQRHNRDFGGSLTDGETIALAGISRNSFYKYKAELRQAKTD